MTNKTATLALILSLVALLLVIARPAGHESVTPVKQETAFERVMRTNTLRCGYGIYPPELVKDANTGALSGYDYDVVSAIGRVLGLKIEWAEESGWGVAEQGIITRRYDMFCNGVWPNPNRTKAVLISMPFIYTPVFAIASSEKKQAEYGTSWINRPDTSIAVISNTSLDMLADFKFPNAKKFYLSDLSGGGDLAMAVAAGKADVTFASYGNIKGFMDSNPGKVQIIDQPVLYAAGGFLLPQDDYRLKHMIDFAITYLLETDAIRDILVKDMPDSQHDWRYPSAEHEP